MGVSVSHTRRYLIFLKNVDFCKLSHRLREMGPTPKRRRENGVVLSITQSQKHDTRFQVGAMEAASSSNFSCIIQLSCEVKQWGKRHLYTSL